MRIYKTLALEEAKIERLMKGNLKGQKSLLAYFQQEQKFQQQLALLLIQSHSLSQHQQKIAIQQQPQLALYRDVNGGSLFWSSQSPAEETIAHYKNPGENNNSDDIRTVFAPYGVCFVENNGRRILKKWYVLVRRGEKVLLYPFSKQDPSYLSKFTLNSNGYLIFISTTNRDKNMCPMKEQTCAMDALYLDINIHKLHTDTQNKKNGEVPSADRKSAELQNVCAAHNMKNRCIASCIFDTCYTFLWNVLHAEK